MVIDYDTSNVSIFKSLVKIINMMRNLEVDTSPDITTITSEKIEVTIDHMDHELPTFC